MCISPTGISALSDSRWSRHNAKGDACSRHVYPEKEEESDVSDHMCACVTCGTIQTRSKGKVPLMSQTQYGTFQVSSSPINVTISRGKAVQNQGDVLINQVGPDWTFDWAPAQDVSWYGGPNIKHELLVAEEEGPITKTGQTVQTTVGVLNFHHIVHGIWPSPGE